ncbi:MAG: signal peptidase II [Ornithinimicrobium sp.]|uniref:signal peptidase II n=1 Tax=Ornithinimicrobium sp. TaxID=1977084 RepID=UPI0026DF89B7|nr:signal peptidase II [Ornithinimicrobium sp.]MDO5740620.1 signal peptidase II [Ornithinimicrobium sp.]
MQAEAGTPLTTARHPRRAALALGLGGMWLALDQVTKAWAERSLTQGEPIAVVGDLLRLHLTYNSGAAFSLGTGFTPVLTVVASIISIIVIWQAIKVRSLPWAIALGLLLGGATGNLVDRYFRAPSPGMGHVVDFLRLPNFPIFNVADIGVTTAACLIALLALRGFHPDGTRDGHAADGPGVKTDAKARSTDSQEAR